MLQNEFSRERWAVRHSSRGLSYQVREWIVPWIDPAFLECTVYFYPSEKEADDGDRVGGTGFVVGFEVGTTEKGRPRLIIPVVVTNKHVLDSGNSTARINTIDGKRDIVALDSARWYGHPDGDDLVVCPMKFNLAHKAAYYFIPSSRFLTKKLITDYEIGPGDDVFIISRFVNHEGKQKNLPSLRFGNIAQMPWEPIKIDGREQESFLVEGRSISGYSGAPVFVYIPPQTPANLNPKFLEQVKAGKVPSLPGVSKTRLGIPIMLGPWLLGVDFCHIRWDEPIWSRITGKAVSDDWFIKSNTGMMGVVPAWKLMDILEGPEMKHVVDDLKKKDAEHRAKASKTDSSVELDVAPRAPSDDEANPQHLADFKRLVDVAARKRPRGGQT